MSLLFHHESEAYYCEYNRWMFEDILIVSHAQDKKLELVVLGFIPLRPKIKKKERFYHFFEENLFISDCIYENM